MKLFQHLAKDHGASFKEESGRRNIIHISNTAITELRIDGVHDARPRLTFLTVNCAKHT